MTAIKAGLSLKLFAFQLVSDEHGGLVRTILETKKGLEAGIDEDATKFLSTSVFDENEREKTKKEVDFE